MIILNKVFSFFTPTYDFLSVLQHTECSVLETSFACSKFTTLYLSAKGFVSEHDGADLQTLSSYTRGGGVFFSESFTTICRPFYIIEHARVYRLSRV